MLDAFPWSHFRTENRVPLFLKMPVFLQPAWPKHDQRTISGMTSPNSPLAAAPAAAAPSLAQPSPEFARDAAPHAARAQHERMANAIRALAMDAVEQAKSGHPGLPMGAADIATVLFTQFLKIDPADSKWPDRDRFVLSAGHGSMLLYALLYLVGSETMTIDQIKRFRQLG